jgi:EpsI family protein
MLDGDWSSDVCSSDLIIGHRGTPAVIRTNLENLPMEIVGYSATDDVFDDSVYQTLNADKHIYRHYRSKDGFIIDLYIGYYGTAKGGRTPHNPYACLPGAGWGIVDDRKVKLKSIKPGMYETVNNITSRKGVVYNVVYHWYQSDRDKILSSGIEQNIQRFKGHIFYNRNDGAFVRVSSITTIEDLDNANTRVRNFSEEILNILPRYWPVEED